MNIEGHVISYAVLESKPAIDEGREIVRVQVNCEPPCRAFCHTVMQFDVPAAVVMLADPGKKGKKKDTVVVSDARDKAIRERVLWKVRIELGDVAKAFTADDLEDATA